MLVYLFLTTYKASFNVSRQSRGELRMWEIMRGRECMDRKRKGESGRDLGMEDGKEEREKEVV